MIQKSARFLLAIALILIALPAHAQEEDRARQMYGLVNQIRLGQGLAPYGWAGELAASAQRHADDLAANLLASHVGSDGSTSLQRIAAAGYIAWGDGVMAGENYWVGHGTPQEAFDWFMGSQPHTDNILNPRYREIGVGISTDVNGRYYYVLNFGARPNVLPIFINDGALTTESPQVAIRLTNEDAYTYGEGTHYMGQAIEIRVSPTLDFEGVVWQPWEPLVAWNLPEQSGEHAVYVQFRDGAGRTATSADTISLIYAGAPPPPTETPTPLPTATPTPTPIPTSLPTATPAPTDTPTPLPTPTNTPEPTPTPTNTPLPTATPTLPPLLTATPFPTWTPLPPEAMPGTTDGLAPLISFLGSLELLAVLLGVYVALRRKS